MGRWRVILLGVVLGGLVGRAAGCTPSGYFAACDTDADCPGQLQCLDNPHFGDGDDSERVCTASCSADRDCPRRDDDHCGKRFDCVDGVCGSNFGCR